MNYSLISAGDLAHSNGLRWRTDAVLEYVLSFETYSNQHASILNFSKHVNYEFCGQLPAAKRETENLDD